MPTYPINFFSQPFAASGDKNIIGETSVTQGRANLPEGFPPITATPIAKGGIAPNRLDFNGILYMLSAMAFWQQSGGMWQYNSDLDYTPPAIVFYAGKYWQCVKASGKDSPVAPGSKAAYWQPLPQFLFQSYPVTLTGDVSGEGTASAAGLDIDVTVNQAAKWTKPVTITFGGDVSGSLTLDGSNPDVSANLTLQVSNDATPVGTVIMYWGSSAPDGYFVCNGGPFDGKKYPLLQKVLGGTTLPDLRNQFVRGASPGRRAVGYRETDAGRNITGTVPGEGRNNVYNQAFTGAFYVSDPTGKYPGTNGAGDIDNVRVSFSASRSWGAAHTANEFRPTNTALLFCIKHD